MIFRLLGLLVCVDDGDRGFFGDSANINEVEFRSMILCYMVKGALHKVILIIVMALGRIL